MQNILRVIAECTVEIGAGEWELDVLLKVDVVE
jgi:hypothetical protein